MSQRQVLPHSSVVVEQNGRDVIAISKATYKTSRYLKPSDEAIRLHQLVKTTGLLTRI